MEDKKGTLKIEAIMIDDDLESLTVDIHKLNLLNMVEIFAVLLKRSPELFEIMVSAKSLNLANNIRNDKDGEQTIPMDVYREGEVEDDNNQTT